MARLKILTYHNVAAPPAGVKLGKLYVSPEQFERQCWLLRRLGLRGVTQTQGLRALYSGDAGRCVVLGFDDGYADNLLYAAPILKRFGFHATCYVVAAHIGGHNAWDAAFLGAQKPLMDAAELQAWLHGGHEIGSHTLTHPHLHQLSRDAAAAEIADSRARLQQLTGAAIDHFCYPFGDFNDEIVELVRAAGYRSAVTTQRGLASAQEDPLRLPRVSINGDKGLGKFALKVATPYAALSRRRRA